MAHAEVGETEVIDAVASKPGMTYAVLILHQARPWNDESLLLLKKKLAFYSESVRSGALLKQRPALEGKSFRIIVLYGEKPSATAEAELKVSKEALSKEQVSLLWGTQRELISLAESP